MLNMYHKKVMEERILKKQVTLFAVALSLLAAGTPIATNAATPVANAAATKVRAASPVAGSQIKLQGAVNVRDLGGYRTESGKVIKPNVLI